MRVARTLFIWLALLLSAAPALARGGYNTTDYRASQPAGTLWYCALSSGASDCGPGPFAGYGNMTCDGVTDDRPGKNTMLETMAASNPARFGVYLPPGHYCRYFEGSALNCSCENAPFTGTTVTNIIWWGYGSSMDFMQIGGSVLYQGAGVIHSSLINTVSAGSTTLVVNDGTEANWSAGDLIMVNGVCGPPGYPPTFQFYEQQMIVSRSGPTITIGQQLANTYEQTWPLYAYPSFATGDCGPAAILKYTPNYNSNVQVFGVTFNPDGSPIQANVLTRNAALYDVTLGQPATMAPSGNKAVFMIRTTAYQGLEIDKQIYLMYLYRSNIGLAGVQSPSPQKMIVDSSNMFCAAGTAVDTEYRNTTVFTGGCTPGAQITLGPVGSGSGQTILLDNAKFSVLDSFQLEIPVSETSFSAGSIRVLKTSNFLNYQRVFQVGAHFKFAWHNAGLGACSPTTTFTVTDIREDSTYYIADTDLGNTLPTPDCFGNLIPTYTQYPATSIKQINTPAGTPNATFYVAP